MEDRRNTTGKVVPPTRKPIRLPVRTTAQRTVEEIICGLVEVHRFHRVKIEDRFHRVKIKVGAMPSR